MMSVNKYNHFYNHHFELVCLTSVRHTNSWLEVHCVQSGHSMAFSAYCYLVSYAHAACWGACRIWAFFSGRWVHLAMGPSFSDHAVALLGGP